MSCPCLNLTSKSEWERHSLCPQGANSLIIFTARSSLKQGSLCKWVISGETCNEGQKQDGAGEEDKRFQWSLTSVSSYGGALECEEHYRQWPILRQRDWPFVHLYHSVISCRLPPREGHIFSGICGHSSPRGWGDFLDKVLSGPLCSLNIPH